MLRREVLPLVCKRFRDLLAQPSAVWQVRTRLPGDEDPCPKPCTRAMMMGLPLILARAQQLILPACCPACMLPLLLLAS